MRRKKKSLTFIIVLVLMFLGIGYAYLTTTLSINGVTDVDSNTWDVHFENVQVTSGSVSGEQVTQAPTIDVNGTTVSYHIRLKEPGDYYEFTVDAVNDGTIDAMINSVTSKLNGTTITTLPTYLKYTITYKYSLPVQENQMIKAGESETYRIRVEYRNDINPSDLPSVSQSLSLSLEVNYIQSDNNGVEVEDSLYSIGYSNAKIGSPLPQDLVTFNSYKAALEANFVPLFNKIVLKNDRIVAAYAGIKVGNEVLLLKGAGATYDEDTWECGHDAIYYEQNKTAMMNFFGATYCNEYLDDSTTYTRCDKDGYSARISNCGFAETFCPGDVSCTAFCQVEANSKVMCGQICAN